MKRLDKKHTTKQVVDKHKPVEFDFIVDEPKRPKFSISQEDVALILKLRHKPNMNIGMLAKIINRPYKETSKILDRLDAIEQEKPFKQMDLTKMKTNVVELHIPSKRDMGCLLAIGDVQYDGNENHYDHDRFVDNLEYCKENNYHILLMGDLIECNLKNSVGSGIFEQRRNPSEQFEDMANILYQYRHLICGVHMSNHEYRVFKETSFEPIKMFAQALGVPLLGHTSYTEVRAGKEKYYLFSMHGFSSARHLSAKQNALRAATAFVEDADAYLMGHVHELDAVAETKLTLVDGQPAWRKAYYVLTGHYLKWKGSYAEMMGMRPGKMGSPKFIFDKTRHHLQVLV